MATISTASLRVRENFTQHGTYANKSINYNQLTNAMEVSFSWKAARFSTLQECPNILWNQKVHYSIHKNPQLFPILSQMNPVHMLPSYLSKIHLYNYPPTSV
jgi:hypothetical protein